MTLFLQVALDGLLNGAVYALVAAGLSLIWGVMDVINFAHGEFLMAAMYVTYWLSFFWHLDPLISWVASGAFAFLLGILAYQLVVKRTIGKSAMAALLGTFGLSMVIKNICLNRFSPNFRLLSDFALEDKTIMAGDIIVPLPQLVTGIFALVVVAILVLVLKRTRFGWAVQATALDKEAAELMGINTEKIYALVFGIGGACVGIAGGSCPPIWRCTLKWGGSSASSPSSAWPWGASAASAALWRRLSSSAWWKPSAVFIWPRW